MDSLLHRENMLNLCTQCTFYEHNETWIFHKLRKKKPTNFPLRPVESLLSVLQPKENHTF